MGEHHIRGLGEIALRVDDLERQERFYRDQVGLEVLRRTPDIAFFRVADGVGGHPQTIVLFRAGSEHAGADDAGSGRRLHHFALEVKRDDFDAERDRLVESGVAVTDGTHPWGPWRSMYFRDPEGNEVELVCHDPSVASDE